jgi:short-subunit dehydrogenase
LYGSTKHYLNGFTLSLQHEYKDTNVTFQLLNPFLVKTPSAVKSLGKEANYQVTASEYAATAVRTLGYSNHTCGHWKHSLTVSYFEEKFNDSLSQHLFLFASILIMMLHFSF